MDHAVPRAPTVSSDLRPLHLIELRQGLLALVASGQRFGKLTSVGLYKDFPLPHAVPLEAGIHSVATVAGMWVHALHVRDYKPANQLVSLVCISDTGKKISFQAACKRYDQYSKPELNQLVKKFGKLLAPLLTEPREQDTYSPAIRAKTPEATPAPRIEGEVLGSIDATIRGWVWCPDQPDKSFVIQILEVDRIVASGRAETYSDALRQRGIGDGGYLFEIPAPPELLDGRKHKLKFFLPEAGELLARELEFEFTRSATEYSSVRP